MVPTLAEREPAFRPGFPAALPETLRRLLGARLVRFLLVGCGGLAADAACYTALAAGGASDALGRALSLALATFVTWRLNRRFTFAGSGRDPGREALRYAGVALCAQGVNYGLFLALRAALPQALPLACLLVSAAAAAMFSFAGQSLVTFASPLRGDVR